MNVNPSKCSVCGGDRLSGFLDGMLDGDVMRQVAQHLVDCESCATELKKLEQTKRLLGQIETPSTPVSPTFWADTYRVARLQGSSASRKAFDVDRVLKRAGMLIGTAGAAAVIALSVFSSAPTVAPNSNAAQTSSDQVDVVSLVAAHANYIAGKHLADGANNRIIRSDLASQTTGDPAIVPTDIFNAEPLVHATPD